MVTLVARYVGGGELGRTEIPQLLDRLRNLRLDELRLTDSTETLAEQRLDRLDAGAVTGDGDLLSEAVATLGTGPGGSCLSGGAGRGLEQMVFAVRGGGLDAIERQADDPAACARIFRAGR